MIECENCCKKIKPETVVIIEDYSWFCSEKCKNLYFEKEEE